MAINEIDVTSPLTATGTTFSTGFTGPKVTLDLGAIDPTKITGTAAILGANSFTASQSITGNLSVTGNIALPNTTSPSSGALTLNGEPFLHRYGGFSNAFVGRGAGNFTMTGTFNSALGANALNLNTSGYSNTALGYDALRNNTEGRDNTVVGREALPINTTGYANTAVGRGALLNNTEGVGNTALGWQALASNTTGNFNTVIGVDALQFSEGRSNIAIGAGAGSDLRGAHEFNIYIGNPGASEDGTIRIGHNLTQTRTFIAGITGVNVAGSAVMVEANGQLGVTKAQRERGSEVPGLKK